VGGEELEARVRLEVTPGSRILACVPRGADANGEALPLGVRKSAGFVRPRCARPGTGTLRAGSANAPGARLLVAQVPLLL
jgi:hypothetical protein